MDRIYIYQAQDHSSFIRFLSVYLIPWPCPKRMHDGSAKSSKPPKTRHRRWIKLSRTQLDICQRRSKDFTAISRTLAVLGRLEEDEKAHNQDCAEEPQEAFAQLPSPEKQQRLNEIAELSTVILIARRRKLIEDPGEDCLPVMEWMIDPQHDFYGMGLIFSLESDFLDACSDILTRSRLVFRVPVEVCKAFYAGGPKTAALYSIFPPQINYKNNFPSCRLPTLRPKRLGGFIFGWKFQHEEPPQPNQ
ncbi:hypothetical protein OIDMADRAFT_55721 [Oidiodendron maius Zn]|uniref:Uncharacterized protein n=1 Tax=Oidiodendron maius (strain Zn) TaxID=913774 RepID=A0A0C3H979_OIDMZ|nr:hypothetical protein OIDMADRAFT_55721 [Oidiodendron maius Zn]